MKKYKIIQESDKITDNEINGFKNFSGLSQSYQRATKRPHVPLYKNKWAFIALIIILLLLLWITGELD